VFAGFFRGAGKITGNFFDSISKSSNLPKNVKFSSRAGTLQGFSRDFLDFAGTLTFTTT
jgi:hypothetical protein